MADEQPVEDTGGQRAIHINFVAYDAFTGSEPQVRNRVLAKFYRYGIDTAPTIANESEEGAAGHRSTSIGHRLRRKDRGVTGSAVDEEMRRCFRRRQF